jgi:undecaprenyl-diphosphatase
MNTIQAIILGIIQGLTEFIPISSTAHLTLAGKIMGLINGGDPKAWTAFMAVIQLGTLLAVLVYFWKDIIRIPGAFFKENIGSERKKYNEQSIDSRMGWLIIIGTIPIVIVGLGLKDLIEGHFTKNLVVIASAMIGLALLLAIAEKKAGFHKKMGDITIKDSIVIGIAQCFALIPGSSRSGTTITAGLFTGLHRETAARFSFLLSIPSVLASGLLEFYQSWPDLNSESIFNLIIATIAAAISGYLSIAFLLRFLRTRTTYLFIFYRIAVGLIIFLFFI